MDTLLIIKSLLVVLCLKHFAHGALDAANCQSNYNGTWLNNTQSCFFLYEPPVNQSQSWSQAQSRCATSYSKVNNAILARLGHIYDRATWTALMPWILNNPNFTDYGGAWLGLYRLTGPAASITASDWRWVNYLFGFQNYLTASNMNAMGVSMNYSASSSFSCAVVVNETTWQPVSCNANYSYLCEVYEITLTGYQMCPHEWIQVGSMCYMPYYSVSNTWTAAQATCAAMGANLPTFQTTADWIAFNNYRANLSLGNDRIWIGANSTLLSLYTYVDRSSFPLISAPFFASGKPTLSLSPQCLVSYQSSSPTYGWSNQGCSLSNTYLICQIQCQLPYIMSYGLCVMDTSKKTNFYDAVQICDGNNASLPIFHNLLQFVGFFLHMTLQDFSGDPWIGLVKTYAPNYWTNIDYSGSNFILWNILSGYPKATGNCAAAQFLTRLMINDDCNANHSTVCMYYPAVAWGSVCPTVNDSYGLSWQKDTYGVNSALCYRYIPEASPTDFLTAMNICYAMGGNLPTMIQQGSNDFWDLMRYAGILNSTQNLAPNNIWLGITQKMEAKSWQTLEGPLLTFNPSWNSGSSSNQPNNYAYADATLSSKWLSDAVSGLHHVICEYRIGYNPSIDNTACLSNLTSPTYYKGRNKAMSGNACLPWANTSKATSYLPRNFCRNAFLNSSTGPWCYTSVDVQEQCFYRCPCASVPCLNGGTCVANGQYNYTCTCTNMYYGNICEFMVTTTSSVSTSTPTSTTILSTSTPTLSTSTSTSSTSKSTTITSPSQPSTSAISTSTSTSTTPTSTSSLTSTSTTSMPPTSIVLSSASTQSTSTSSSTLSSTPVTSITISTSVPETTTPFAPALNITTPFRITTTFPESTTPSSASSTSMPTSSSTSTSTSSFSTSSTTSSSTSVTTSSTPTSPFMTTSTSSPPTSAPSTITTSTPSSPLPITTSSISSSSLPVTPSSPSTSSLEPSTFVSTLIPTTLISTSSDSFFATSSSSFLMSSVASLQSSTSTAIPSTSTISTSAASSFMSTASMSLCDSNPCLNSGTCVDTGEEYTCECLPPYYGTACDMVTTTPLTLAPVTISTSVLETTVPFAPALNTTTPFHITTTFPESTTPSSASSPSTSTSSSTSNSTSSFSLLTSMSTPTQSTSVPTTTLAVDSTSTENPTTSIPVITTTPVLSLTSIPSSTIFSTIPSTVTSNLTESSVPINTTTASLPSTTIAETSTELTTMIPSASSSVSSFISTAAHTTSVTITTTSDNPTSIFSTTFPITTSASNSTTMSSQSQSLEHTTTASLSSAYAEGSSVLTSSIIPSSVSTSTATQLTESSSYTAVPTISLRVTTESLVPTTSDSATTATTATTAANASVRSTTIPSTTSAESTNSAAVTKELTQITTAVSSTPLEYSISLPITTTVSSKHSLFQTTDSSTLRSTDQIFPVMSSVSSSSSSVLPTASTISTPSFTSPLSASIQLTTSIISSNPNSVATELGTSSAAPVNSTSLSPISTSIASSPSSTLAASRSFFSPSTTLSSSSPSFSQIITQSATSTLTSQLTSGATPVILGPSTASNSPSSAILIPQNIRVETTQIPYLIIEDTTLDTDSSTIATSTMGDNVSDILSTIHDVQTDSSEIDSTTESLVDNTLSTIGDMATSQLHSSPPSAGIQQTETTSSAPSPEMTSKDVSSATTTSSSGETAETVSPNEQTILHSDFPPTTPAEPYTTANTNSGTTQFLGMTNSIPYSSTTANKDEIISESLGTTAPLTSTSPTHLTSSAETLSSEKVSTLSLVTPIKDDTAEMSSNPVDDTTIWSIYISTKANASVSTASLETLLTTDAIKQLLNTSTPASSSFVPGESTASWQTVSSEKEPVTTAPNVMLITSTSIIQSSAGITTLSQSLESSSVVSLSPVGNSGSANNTASTSLLASTVTDMPIDAETLFTSTNQEDNQPSHASSSFNSVSLTTFTTANASKQASTTSVVLITGTSYSSSSTSDVSNLNTNAIATDSSHIYESTTTAQLINSESSYTSFSPTAFISTSVKQEQPFPSIAGEISTVSSTAVEPVEMASSSIAPLLKTSTVAPLASEQPAAATSAVLSSTPILYSTVAPSTAAAERGSYQSVTTPAIFENDWTNSTIFISESEPYTIPSTFTSFPTTTLYSTMPSDNLVSPTTANYLPNESSPISDMFLQSTTGAQPTSMFSSLTSLITETNATMDITAASDMENTISKLVEYLATNGTSTLLFTTETLSPGAVSQNTATDEHTIVPTLDLHSTTSFITNDPSTIQEFSSSAETTSIHPMPFTSYFTAVSSVDTTAMAIASSTTAQDLLQITTEFSNVSTTRMMSTVVTTNKNSSSQRVTIENFWVTDPAPTAATTLYSSASTTKQADSAHYGAKTPLSPEFDSTDISSIVSPPSTASEIANSTSETPSMIYKSTTPLSSTTAHSSTREHINDINANQTSSTASQNAGILFTSTHQYSNKNYNTSFISINLYSSTNVPSASAKYNTTTAYDQANIAKTLLTSTEYFSSTGKTIESLSTTLSPISSTVEQSVTTDVATVTTPNFTSAIFVSQAVQTKTTEHQLLADTASTGISHFPSSGISPASTTKAIVVTEFYGNKPTIAEYPSPNYTKNEALSTIVSSGKETTIFSTTLFSMPSTLTPNVSAWNYDITTTAATPYNVTISSSNINFSSFTFAPLATSALFSLNTTVSKYFSSTTSPSALSTVLNGTHSYFDLTDDSSTTAAPLFPNENSPNISTITTTTIVNSTTIAQSSSQDATKTTDVNEIYTTFASTTIKISPNSSIFEPSPSLNADVTTTTVPSTLSSDKVSTEKTIASTKHESKTWSNSQTTSAKLSSVTEIVNTKQLSTSKVSIATNTDVSQKSTISVTPPFSKSIPTQSFSTSSVHPTISSPTTETTPESFKSSTKSAATITSSTTPLVSKVATSTTKHPTTKSNKPSSSSRQPFHTMNTAEWTAAVVFQTMGCTFLIGSIATTLALMILFRHFTIEKIIVINQDLAILIAHCLVMTLREPRLYNGMSPTLCTVVAMALQYFYIAAYTFMLLEGLQMMSIIARVRLYGGLMPWYINLAIGWGTPLVTVLLSAPFIGSKYSTSWTCWGDLESNYNWAVMAPIVGICSATAIVVESAGMTGRNDPASLRNLTEPVQLFSARISQRGIMFIMPLTASSHVLGLMAVYFQIVYLYVACFFLNVFCGCGIFFFHTAMDPKIRTFVSVAFMKAKAFICRR